MSKAVVVERLPLCDFHKEQGVETPAKYDAKTIFGPWAYLCQRCYQNYGPGQLGTGFGQQLLVRSP